MNQTTAALGCLLLVLVVATRSTRRVAIATSLVVFAGYDFFVLPPVHTFAIARSDDVVALLVLLAVSLIGSHLSQQARQRAQAALALERERDASEIARRGAEMKSALVASLSHDLKTPLTALTVAAGNLEMSELPDAERRQQLRIVGSELERLRRLFDAVVDLASVEARAMTAEPEWVTPADVIEAASRQARLPAQPPRLHVHGESDTWMMRVDPRLLSAAIAHVIENAVAYSPVNTPIDVDVSMPAGEVVIVVRDYGAGIPPTDLDRIFERFYRASELPFGSGMGLAIARGLLELQGATITAANHPDGGAVFTIRIPAARRRALEDLVEAG